MIKRLAFSRSKRVAIFEKEKGICHICSMKVDAGQSWDVSHEIPLALGGSDQEANWRIAHRRCHRILTATVDRPRIAKAERQYAKHIGAQPRSHHVIQKNPFCKVNLHKFR